MEGSSHPFFLIGLATSYSGHPAHKRKKCGVPAVGLELRSSDRRPYNTNQSAPEPTPSNEAWQ